MTRAFLLAALAALLAVPAAEANGDPASDVLITRQVFLPTEAPISATTQEQLLKAVADANDRGYPIRLAVIAFTGDLGTAVSLWRHPQSYAKFLGSELTFVYTKRLLVAMPSGFGIYHGQRPVAKERRVLARTPVGKTPTALANSTITAVRALAAANGISLPGSSGGGHDWRDRGIIAGCGLLVLLIILVPGRWLRRGRTDPARQEH
jgi:hypothetical protein